MEEERFCRACQLRDEGKLGEAYAEFARIAEAASDPLDKAGALIYGANTLEMSEQIEAAAAQLNVARSLMKEHSDRNLGRDEEFAALQLFLDYEDANICWLQSGGLETALNKFETTIKKHDLKNVRRKPNMTPKESHAYSFYQAIEIRRGFILADLGRWKEALSVLEGIESPQEFKEGIAFYLGHCYFSARDLDRAEEKIKEALALGLPKSLEYRAHCELGVTYYYLKEYGKAKEELESVTRMADFNCFRTPELWKWLEATCRALGLRAEAENYARLARPS